MCACVVGIARGGRRCRCGVACARARQGLIRCPPVYTPPHSSTPPPLGGQASIYATRSQDREDPTAQYGGYTPERVIGLPACLEVEPYRFEFYRPHGKRYARRAYRCANSEIAGARAKPTRDAELGTRRSNPRWGSDGVAAHGPHAARHGLRVRLCSMASAQADAGPWPTPHAHAKRRAWPPCAPWRGGRAYCTVTLRLFGTNQSLDQHRTCGAQAPLRVVEATKRRSEAVVRRC